MERVDEEATPGEPLRYPARRGQEVLHVTEPQELRAWTCPYTGPRWFHAPKFRATAQRAEELAAEVAQRTSTMAGTLRVARCSPDAEDGTAEWAVTALAEHDSTTAGD